MGGKSLITFMAVAVILLGVTGGSALAQSSLITKDSLIAQAPSTGAPEAPAEEASAPQTPFEYDYFEELMEPAPHESERLCGLDKVCVKLWKSGKLEVYKEGRLLEGDFNGDGVADAAMILEKDSKTEQVGKDYWIYVSTAAAAAKSDAASATKSDAAAAAKTDAPPVKEGHKLMLYSQIPDAFNVVEFGWDEEKKALVIDIGERIMHTNASMYMDPAGMVGNNMSGKTEKVLVLVSWNPTSQKYEMHEPVKSRKHKGKKSGR